MKIRCAKYENIDDCRKIKSLGSHDYAGDWQYAESIIKQCRGCEHLVEIVDEYPCDGCGQKLRDAALNKPKEELCFNTCHYLKAWKERNGK